MKILELLQLFLTLGVIVGPLPNTIANGQTEDAVPVMANYNWILNQVNANAAPLNNPTFTGVVTAVTGAFTNITASGTLGVTGTSTLGVVNAGAFSGTTGVFTNNVSSPQTVVSTNNSVGATAEAQFQASNGVQTSFFGVTGTGYTPYGALGAGNAKIYSASNIVIMADTGGNVVKIAAGGSTAICTISSTGLAIAGALSKSSGTFDIVHPLDDTRRLRHSFIEGPRYDLIYRNHVQLVNGKAIVNIDSACTDGVAMTSGTFVALTQNPDIFLQNKTGWAQLRGSIQGAILTIEANDATSSDTVSWMVVVERIDDHIKTGAGGMADANGDLILEYVPASKEVTKA